MAQFGAGSWFELTFLERKFSNVAQNLLVDVLQPVTPQ